MVITRTWTLADDCGNSVSKDQTITVEDNIAPTLACEDNTIFLEPDGFYTLMEDDALDLANTFDNCSDVTVTGFSQSEFSCDDLGQTIPVTVSAQDDCGNESTCVAGITVEQGSALPEPWEEEELGQSEGDATFAPCDNEGEFTLTSDGAAFPNSSDNFQFVYQELCGDITLTAKITQFTPNGWQGLAIRNGTGDKDASVFQLVRGNTPAMPSNLTRVDFTNQDGGMGMTELAYSIALPFWVRLESEATAFGGRYVKLYASSDGINYILYRSKYIPGLNDCVEVGLALQAFVPGDEVEAKFAFVSADGSSSSAFASNQLRNRSDSRPDELLVNVFPNPADELINIETNQPFPEDAPFALRNELGQVLQQGVLSAGTMLQQLQVGDLPKGMYTIELRFEESGRKVFRFIKQ